MPVPNSAYRGQNTANTHLKWDEFVTPSIPVATTDLRQVNTSGLGSRSRRLSSTVCGVWLHYFDRPQHLPAAVPVRVEATVPDNGFPNG